MNRLSLILLLGITVLAHSALRNPAPAPTLATNSLVATNVTKQPVNVKNLNKELKGLEGQYKNGRYITPSDTNYKNDKSATGDWGNEYGPAPQEVTAAQKKKKTEPDTEHTDGETHPEDWRGEYKNPQTDSRWEGRVGDTDYYREKSSAASYGAAVALTAPALFFL